MDEDGSVDLTVSQSVCHAVSQQFIGSSETDYRNKLHHHRRRRCRKSLGACCCCQNSVVNRCDYMI